MITLANLLKATPRPIMNRALKQCRVHVSRSVFDTDNIGYHKSVTATVKATDGDRFTIIKFYDTNKKKLVDSKVWVHCSCEFYKFTLEVANSLRNSSDVVDSNGNFPHIRNPDAKPYLCKHLAALARIAPTVAAKPIKDFGDISKEEIELVTRQLAPVLDKAKANANVDALVRKAIGR